MKEQVIIKVRGGLVQGVVSTNQDLEVLVCDYDNDGSDTEEVERIHQIEKMEMENIFYPVY